MGGDRAEVRIANGRDIVFLTYPKTQAGNDAALDLFEKLCEAFEECRPNGVTALVLEGGAFSCHTRRFPKA